jgi:hypothetical protein
MNSRLPLAALSLALALAAPACTITTSRTPASAAAPAEKKVAEPAKAPAATKVPDPPKTPAPEVAAKPAKAEAVPVAKRTAPPAPASWDVIQDPDYGLQFKVPSRWNSQTTTTDTGGNVFVAAPPDGSLVLSVVTFANPNLSDEQVLSIFLDNLGFHVDGEYQRIDDGLIVAKGTGTNAGQDVYFVAMVYAYEENNYVTYIVTPTDQATKNGETMRQILESFELI